MRSSHLAGMPRGSVSGLRLAFLVSPSPKTRREACAGLGSGAPEANQTQSQPSGVHCPVGDTDIGCNYNLVTGFPQGMAETQGAKPTLGAVSRSGALCAKRVPCHPGIHHLCFTDEVEKDQADHPGPQLMLLTPTSWERCAGLRPDEWLGVFQVTGKGGGTRQRDQHVSRPRDPPAGLGHWWSAAQGLPRGFPCPPPVPGPLTSQDPTCSTPY